jgi:hypothetical protein
LRFLGPAAKQDDNQGSPPPEVHAIARTEINPHFLHTFANRFTVSKEEPIAAALLWIDLWRTRQQHAT